MNELTAGIAEVTDGFQFYHNVRRTIDNKFNLRIEEIYANDRIEPSWSERGEIYIQVEKAYMNGLRLLNEYNQVSNQQVMETV